MEAAVAAPTLRWSSVKDCPRKAVYEATGAPARQRSNKEERILFRGQSLGRDYAAFLAQTHGAENVETEVPIRWPLGTGHMDIYLTATRTAIEVLSTLHASDQMIQSKLLQLVGYIEYADFPVDAGALVILNPSDFGEDVFPVARTSRVYKDLVDEMRERVAQVQAWAADPTLIPARVCGKPADAIGRFCLHAAHCFEGWEPPPLHLVDDAEADMLASRWYALKEQERGAAKVTKDLADERKKVEGELVERVPVGQHQVGGWAVTRTHVQRSATVDLKKAEIAGYPVESLGEFLRDGAEYDTFKVARLDEAPEDFGEVPF